MNRESYRSSEVDPVWRAKPVSSIAGYTESEINHLYGYLYG